MEWLTPDVIAILTETGLSTILAVLYFTDLRTIKEKIWTYEELLRSIQKTVEKIEKKEEEENLLKKVEEMIQNKK